MGATCASWPTVPPDVSFVVPLYNRLDLTRPFAASLAATVPVSVQSETVFVDDGSTDGTRDWLVEQEAAGARVILNPSNQGYAIANNRGASVTRGRCLVLLNNDLILRPGWLEQLLAVHRRLGKRAGAVGNVQRRVAGGTLDHTGLVVNHQGKPVHRRSLPLAARLRGFGVVPAVTGACLLIGRELWDRLGGFDEAFRNGGEDVDLCFRALRAGQVNAVATRRWIWHHVSASPGRKEHDEANSLRLVRRWHDLLAQLARPAWTREYLKQHFSEPRDYPDPQLARQAALFALGLRPPPRRAAEGTRAALAAELARWNRLGVS